MKYIKLFENLNNYQRLSYNEAGEEDTLEYSNKELVEIYDEIKINFDVKIEFVSSQITVSKGYDNDISLIKPTYIYKLGDDYYLLKVCLRKQNRKEEDNYQYHNSDAIEFYKCDQIDGLISLLKEKYPDCVK